MNSDRPRIAIGIEYSSRSIRVASSAGHRVEISGSFDDPEVWLDHVFYGLSAPPRAALLGMLALPLRAFKEDVTELRRALEQRLTLAELCSTPTAVARGSDFCGPKPSRSGLVAHVIEDETSLELYHEGALMASDIVRRIPGREAREVAVAARCLLKTLGRSQRDSAEMSIAGHATALNLWGRGGLLKELAALGLKPVMSEDSQVVAAGAMALAEALGEG